MTATENGIAAAEIQSYFARWRRLEEEKAALGEDLKELFAEAKGNGFDSKGMRAAFRRKLALETRSDEVQEHEAIVELYLQALDENPTHRTSHARDALEAILKPAAPSHPVPEGKGSGKNVVAEVPGAGGVTPVICGEAIKTAATGDQDKATRPAPAPVPPATSQNDVRPPYEATPNPSPTIRTFSGPQPITEDVPGFLRRTG
jgi:uncharacterized protein (UPF0335 family)